MGEFSAILGSVLRVLNVQNVVGNILAWRHMCNFGECSFK